MSEETQESSTTQDVQTAAESLPPAPPPEPVGPAANGIFIRLSKGRLALMLGAVAVFLFAFFTASVSILDYTESVEFCSTCHVMKPEVTVYENSPHARTECGTCHIGPGAIAAIEAKLENVRYLWVYPLNRYERPIASPIKSLRPVEVVCEQCHWPQKFYDDRLVTRSQYAQDAANSLTRTQLLLRTGGGARSAGLGRGIHWHIENPVYYIATDEKRQVIPWVQAEFEGVRVEYMSTDANLTPAYIAKAEKRKMDCVDCHNRATHIFRSPDEALDAALAAGLIPADLPFIKREGMQVLGRIYGSEAEATQAVAAVADFYRVNYPDLFSRREADVKKAVDALQDIFNNTQFPFMRVNWQTHANNIGHKDSAGCFRCHDGKHVSSDNQFIRLECNICHTIPQVAGPGKPLPPLTMAIAKEPPSHLSTSWLAEHRYTFDASCANCHTVSNPGGSDNTSFCSNSACHGTEWTYVGLNAPRIRELTVPTRIPSTGGPRSIPHPVGATTDCLLCHAAGKVHPFPANHSSFQNDQCTACHKLTVQEGGAAPASPTPAPPPTSAPATPTSAPAAPSPPPTATPATGSLPSIPHSLEGRNDCLMCHDIGKLKPFPQDHTGRTNDTCQACHKPQ